VTRSRRRGHVADAINADRVRAIDGGVGPGVKKVYSAPTLMRWGAVEDLTRAVGNLGADGLVGSTSGG
jgi:hypothetical protein